MSTCQSSSPGMGAAEADDRAFADEGKPGEIGKKLILSP